MVKTRSTTMNKQGDTDSQAEGPEGAITTPEAREHSPQPSTSRSSSKADCREGTGGMQATLELLASALNNLTANNNVNSSLLSRLSAHKELPIYSGDPVEWLQFKQAYEESTRMCNFTDKENLWRLRRCLRGPAREAVTALLIGATSSLEVMETLELQFGNGDVIIHSIMNEVKKLPIMCTEYYRDIVAFSIKVKNYVAAVRAIGRGEYLHDTNITAIIINKLPTVLISKWADYSYSHILEGKLSKLEILSQFLSQEAVKLSTATIMTSVKRTQKQHVLVHANEKNSYNINKGDELCKYCNINKHVLTDCKRFKGALNKQKWNFVKKQRLCFKCIISRHSRENCPAPVCSKEGCGKDHHVLLHFTPKRHAVEGEPVAHAEEHRDGATVLYSEESVKDINVSHKVLLKVVPINVHGPNGVARVHALLDDGSTVSLLSGALASRLGLRGRRHRMNVGGAWNEAEIVCDATTMNFDISNMDGTLYNINACAINELNLPVQTLSLVNFNNYSHLCKIKDYVCHDDVKPEMLIGQDNSSLLICLQTIVGNRSAPYATRTPLGWCVHGCVSVSASFPNRVLHIDRRAAAEERESEQLLRKIHDDIRNSFSIENMGVSGKPRQNFDEQRAWEALRQTATLMNGRWYVGLPWKSSNCIMPNSLNNALSRFLGVERKMSLCSGYKQRYIERINHLLENDYAEEFIENDVYSNVNNVNNSETPHRVWYLPHFGVDNPNKKKLRVVMDAAAKCRGFSLNDYLLKGPDLLISLFGVMLRFRENKIAVTGDIKDMFLRVKIRHEDRSALRFLWRENPDQPIKTYVMSSLLFGANCSPFVAQFIKNENAKRFEGTMPGAVSAICSQHYMDDYIDSVADENEAIRLVRDVIYVHSQGGFEIRNWTSNNMNVLNSIPKEALGNAAVKFKIGEYEGERTLGLIWFPSDDTLGFDVSLKKIPEDIVSGKRQPTKREMLRVVMSIFDVYGFLSPFTIMGKIMLQDTWRSNIGWDEVICNNVYIKWCEWLATLQVVQDVRIPRYYEVAASGTSEACGDESARYSALQLHVFCDASTKAMCAVAYWRWKRGDDIYVAFVASKCRVAPVRFVSVPRLELQAALLAARLADTIVREHKIRVERRYFWSDSSTVLHWIKNNNRTYKTFVAHRLGEIDELSQADEWRYVPTKINIADVATRDKCNMDVLKNEWFKGPVFLWGREEQSWPEQPNFLSQHEDELVSMECLTLVKNEINDLPVPDPLRFSSWLRLLRATAAVCKFVYKCRKLTFTDDIIMGLAERLLIRYSQLQCFSKELSLIVNNVCLNKSSRLLTLSPFVDEYGILRVGGRIDAATKISDEMKKPVILDGHNHISKLIVHFYHVKAAHGNQETVVNELKQRYWIIRLRPTVKTVTSRCSFCRIHRAKPQIPRMGDLPEARLAHHYRAFTHCGVDLFGPMTVTVGRRRELRYGVLFTCMTVRAVHLELVSTLTTDSLIMALRRMAARRGWPQHLYSDNGTNLRGADKELRKATQELDANTLTQEALNNGASWTFIPPASPHWGGAWERLIRSVKNTLKVILKEQTPKDEVLSTLIAEVENIVNSRPLTHVSVEPGSGVSLTPHHFLIGTSSNLPLMGKFTEADLCLRKQWRIAQALADCFWKRWVREVLPSLLPRSKWNQEQRRLGVGDVVLIADPNNPRNCWPRGIIQGAFPGRDGRVRVVEVRTTSGTLTRSAARVVRIV